MVPEAEPPPLRHRATRQLREADLPQPLRHSIGERTADPHRAHGALRRTKMSHARHTNIRPRQLATPALASAGVCLRRDTVLRILRRRPATILRGATMDLSARLQSRHHAHPLLAARRQTHTLTVRPLHHDRCPHSRPRSHHSRPRSHHNRPRSSNGDNRRQRQHGGRGRTQCRKQAL